MKIRLVWGLLAALPVIAALSPASSNKPPNSPFLSPSLQVSKQPLLASVLDVDESLLNCRPTGLINDARCDYETVERDINTSNFFQTLSNLVKEKYFRFYKVDLYKDCPFWNENSLCMSQDCTVSKVDEFQIPVEYRTACLSSLKTTDEAEVISDTNGLSSSTHNHHSTKQSPLHGKKDTCQCAETDFCHWEDEEWSSESSWVDLIDNPEQFTGYSGPGAHKVWRSIYEENCFGVARSSYTASQSGNVLSTGIESTRRDSRKAAEAFSNLLRKQPAQSTSEQCLEKRVFYKIISGLHASISIHICHDHLDQMTGERKPNLQCFVERIAQHPERLQNVYFNHVVLTRALAKLAERLGMTRDSQDEIKKDRQMDRQRLARLAPGLPISPTNHSLGRLLQQSLDSPPTFDEASMFDSQNSESEYLRKEFRDKFRNVSRIMDCVGCDKCRLWGKLQVNGLGTALKILFDGSLHLKKDLFLQRSELVALINTVHRISESIRAVETFREMYQEKIVQDNLKKNLEKAEQHNKSANNINSNVKNSSSKTAQSSSRTSKRIDSTLPGESLLQQAKYVVNRGRHVCESQWEKCLSWVLTLFDNSRGQSKSKPEL